jgi:hypothetical protein
MACDSELCHGAWASLIVQETGLFLSRSEATPVLPVLSVAEGSKGAKPKERILSSANGRFSRQEARFFAFAALRLRMTIRQFRLDRALESGNWLLLRWSRYLLLHREWDLDRCLQHCTPPSEKDNQVIHEMLVTLGARICRRLNDIEKGRKKLALPAHEYHSVSCGAFNSSNALQPTRQTNNTRAEGSCPEPSRSLEGSARPHPYRMECLNS